MDIKMINSANARKSFSDMLSEAEYAHKRMIITRKGKPAAAVIPIEDLDLLEAIEDKKDVEAAQKVLSNDESEFISWEKAKRELSAE
ncbi:MAG TPA: type II toxin-antitoxin system Phd/YefM family antitoxin [Balneolaceae bacterium]|nr:type II toxin-antitoxin system Phd/YefM family antitoxin [Balneolaceae bacterium]